MRVSCAAEDRLSPHEEDKPSIWAPARRRLTIGVTLVVGATAFEALAVATVLPVTLRELGGLPFYGWTFSAFMLSNIVGITVGGSESHRFGLARMFVIGTALFCAGLAVSGFAPSMLVIVGGRVLQGFGSGLLFTIAYVSIARAFPVELQPRMLATLSSAWVIPGLVGPGLASLISEHASWRWVFLGLLPLQLMAAALVVPALSALPPTPARPPERTDRIWLAVQLGGGVTAALSGLGMDDVLPAVALVIAGGAIAVRALRRLFPPGTLTARPGVPAAVATMALINFAFFGTEAFVPLALSHVRNAPVWLSGLALTGAAITWTTGAWLPVRLEGKASRRTIIVSGLAIIALGFAATLAILSPQFPASLIVVAWAVTGLGTGLAFTTTSAAILESAAPGEEGSASASLQLSQVLGTAVATGVGGALVAAPFAGDPPVYGIGVVDVMTLAATLLAIFTARRIPNQFLRGP